MITTVLKHLRARAWLALVVVAACSTTEEVTPLGLGDGCVIATDCKAPLACVFARCHQPCNETRDCPTGQRCIVGSGDRVCQLPDERECEYNSDCPPPEVCAVDGKCRDQCVSDSDCVKGQLCISGTCAEPSELVDGGLPGDVPSSGTPCV